MIESTTETGSLSPCAIMTIAKPLLAPIEGVGVEKECVHCWDNFVSWPGCWEVVESRRIGTFPGRC